MNEVGIIAQLSQSAFLRVLPDGMQLAHFFVLNHMVRMGDGWTPVRLAKAFQVTKGAMTNTLQRLDARALVRIEPDPDDGRSKRVYLTPEGAAMREQCIARLHPELARLHDALGTELFTSALPLLQRLRGWLDQDRDDRPPPLP